MKKFLLLFLLLVPFFIFAAGTIEINTATLQQLDELTGIGPKYAQAIIDARPFSSVDDLLKVKGIGPTTLQKIKDQGLAYVSGQVPQAPATDQNLAVVENTTPNKTLTAEPIGALNEPKNTVLQQTYPNGIFINEVLPNPEGADETNEWIELYNSNNFEVDLSGWQIQDTVGTITTYTLSTSTKVLANGFKLFSRPDTNIMLNNDSDGINLLTPDKKIVNSVSFTKAPLGQSYSKSLTGWQWSTILTPGAKNAIAAKEALSNAKNSVKNDSVAQGLASVSQNIETNQESNKTNPWFLFFIVLAVTIILAAFVLITKLKIQKNVRT